MNTYNGSCHCGGVTFTFDHGKIENGLRCNCSICRRKGAVMSDFTISPNDISFSVDISTLGKYQFDTKVAKHYFCKTCGIYPFHETLVNPGYFRVNLGCIDMIDTNSINVKVHDGKNK